MMGRAHATSGALAFAAPAAVLGFSPETLVLGTCVCAGAAVLPDIDHPGSGVSRTFGPVTRAFAVGVRALSGGHRNGTHSGLGAGVFSALAFLGAALHARSWVILAIGAAVSGALVASGWLAAAADSGKGRGRPAYKRRLHGFVSLWVVAAACCGLLAACAAAPRVTGAVILWVLLVLTLAAMIRPLKIKGKLDDYAPIPVAAFLLWSGADVSVVPYAIALGVAVHVPGDMVTKGGAPWGWPWSQTMFGPGWFKTNSPVENRIVFPSLAGLLVVALAFGTGALPAVLGP